MGRRATLTRDDWIEAATDWVATHGVASLAVEPLARALGVTKGAFYWCFANRDELLLAVLERWEAQGTQAIIELVEQVPDTAQQARELIRIVTRTVEGRGPDLPRPVPVEIGAGRRRVGILAIVDEQVRGRRFEGHAARLHVLP